MLVVQDNLVHGGGAALALDLPLAAAQALQRQSGQLRPPVAGNVYGVLMNDPAALAALGDTVNAAPYKAAPKAPVMYMKPRHTVSGHGADIPVPPGAELALGPCLGIVIGRSACRVKEEDAGKFIAGYVVVNDVSLPHGSFYRPSVRFRSRDGFCPVGPWVRAARHVADPDHATVRVFIDGELVLERAPGFTRPVARLLQDVTDFMTLQAGDVLLAGSVYPAPLARAGQAVAVEIEGVGRLENRIVEESFAGEGK